MRGMSTLRAAVLGAVLTTSLSVYAQTPPATQQAQSSAPVGTAQAGTAQPAPAAAPNPKAVAATVNGHPIFEGAVQRALERIPPARRHEFRAGLIDSLVNNLLIDLSLKHAGYKVDKEEVDKRITEMKAELKKFNRDFDKMLAELKVPESELREHIEADLRWFKYASAQATDPAVQKLFNDNRDMFDGSTVHAQHILITPKDKDAASRQATITELQQIKAKVEEEVKAGMAAVKADDKLEREKERAKLISDSFAKYAKEKSHCPSKTNRGLVGPFPKAGVMVPSFANTAFALQPFQLSEIVETPFGYHLILCVERKAGQEIKYEQIKDIVKEVFFDQLLERTATHLRSQAKIVVNPPPQ